MTFDMFNPEGAQPVPKTLRPHQVRAIEMVRASLAKGNRRVVCQGPTGFGKTLVAAKIIEGALAKGKKVIFTAPAISLIDQTVTAFENEGIRDIGVMQASHVRTNRLAKVQVASVQTLARREIPDASLVLVDECHIRSEAVEKLMDERPDVFFIGLSATPWAKGMGHRWQDLVIPTTIGDLIDGGFLSKFTAYAPDVPDLSGVKTVAGEYAEAGLQEVMGDAKLMGSVVHTWLEKGEDRPTLCFAVNRAHAADLKAEFERNGVSAGYVDANTDMIERQRLNEQFKRGEVKVICSVRTMTTGVDLPVSCIIDAAPTKSEMLHVQKIGRGLRVNPGTEDCLSADTDVLTDKGICKISDITLDHKVWDGVSFVHHGGAVCRGTRPVISYDGLTGTPDHRVMTEHGWRTLDEAASGRLRIARTGIGRFPLRFLADRVPQGGRSIGQAESGSAVRSLRSHAHGAVSQHSEAPRHEGLPELQWAPAGDGSEVALCEVPRSAGPLPEPEFSLLWPLRREGHRIQVREPECCGDVGRGDAGRCEPVDGAGSDRQQWALRAGQSPLGAPCAEHREQPKIQGLPGSVHRLQAGEPGSQVFRSLVGGHDPARDDRCGNCAEVGGISGEQPCEEVWDILNAGPLQRFTANGRLVHNCLILDHAGNSLRLGLVTDIRHERLDTTEKGAKQERKPKAEKLPEPCSKCGGLHVGAICPHCGHEKRPVANVARKDGDLVEITGKKRPATSAEKQAFWSMAKWMQQERGWSDGRTAHFYRDRFAVWPRGLHDDPVYPDRAFFNYEKARRIAYAKRKAAERGEE